MREATQNATSADDRAKQEKAERQNLTIVAVMATDHLRDLGRVQSIIWSMAAALRSEIKEAEEKLEDLMETSEPEAFMENVVWLMSYLYDQSGHDLKKALAEAGWPA